MTITLTPAHEKAVQEAIQAGLVRSVDELIDIALETLPSPGGPAEVNAANKPTLPVLHLGPMGALRRRDMYDDAR